MQPNAYVYLNQIPYTGLDLGPVGTVIYWLALILWSPCARVPASSLRWCHTYAIARSSSVMK
jgi:hypothetical protein